MGDDGPKLPCRFCDMPGIDKDKTIKKEDFEKIISGERKIFLEVDIYLFIDTCT